MLVNYIIHLTEINRCKRKLIY